MNSMFGMNSLFGSIKEAKAALIRAHTTPETVNAVLRERLKYLESLPINQKHCCGRVVGFVMIAGEWWSVNILNRLRYGWVEWSRTEADVSISQGLASLGEWAECDADGNVSLPDEVYAALGVKFEEATK